ncbi:hypothetical protein [Halobacillus mangrovi]
MEDLEPEVAVTGHGLPMNGDELKENLRKLNRNFNEIAIPDHGKFVDDNK